MLPQNRTLLIQRSCLLLQAIGKEESKYSRILRDRVHGGASHIHWIHFRDGLIEEFGEERWTYLADVERTTDWAWRSGRQKPLMDHLFGINTIRLRRALKDAAHPHPSGAIWYSIAWTMARIRKEDLKLPAANFRRENLRVLAAAARHPRLGALLHGQISQQAQTQILVEIAENAGCELNERDATKANLAKNTIELWLDSYCLLFGFSRPGWEGLLDEAR